MPFWIVDVENGTPSVSVTQPVSTTAALAPLCIDIFVYPSCRSQEAKIVKYFVLNELHSAQTSILPFLSLAAQLSRVKNLFYRCTQKYPRGGGIKLVTPKDIVRYVRLSLHLWVLTIER